MEIPADIESQRKRRNTNDSDSSSEDQSENSNSDNELENSSDGQKPHVVLPPRTIGEKISFYSYLCCVFIWKDKFFISWLWLVTGALILLGVFVWTDFTWKAWYSIVVVFLTFSALIKNVTGADVIMLLSTTLLLLPEIITPKQGIEGFSSVGIFTIAVLFILAAGLANTGILQFVTRFLLPENSRFIRIVMARFMIPICIASAFINNTPLMAMMLPVIERFCVNTKTAPSKLLIPLSYSTILGGTCTMIGTSTNLVVQSLVQARDPSIEFPLFEIGKVGIPIAVAGLFYVIIFGPWILPTRESPSLTVLNHPKKYQVVVEVTSASKLIGKTTDHPSLPNLRGLSLAELRRGDQVYLNTESHLIREGDLLVYVGDVMKVSDLFRIKGLKPSNKDNQRLNPSKKHVVCEAIVSPKGSLNGKTVGEIDFPEEFGAVVMSVARDGEPVRAKLSQIELKTGDCLLLLCKKSFLERPTGPWGDDFMYISQVDIGPIRYDIFKMIIAPVLFATMIILNAVEISDLLTMAMAVGFLYLFLRCITVKQAVKAANYRLIVMIAASFAMATALEVTGVAVEIADNMLTIFKPVGDWGLLFGVYLATVVLTALLSNASAAAVMIPIVFNLASSGQTTIHIKAFCYIIMVGASADFSTPIGYQTNLMAWGPGGYKFTDYTIFGLPLQLTLAIISTSLIKFFFAAGPTDVAPPPPSAC